MAPTALRIADALEPYGVYWLEDSIDLANLDDLARYKAAVRVRVTGSEYHGTKVWYREAFQRGAIDVAHFDIAWIGGLTRPGRSPRWPRPSTGRSHRTTARAP